MPLQFPIWRRWQVIFNAADRLTIEENRESSFAARLRPRLLRLTPLEDRTATSETLTFLLGQLWLTSFEPSVPFKSDESQPSSLLRFVPRGKYRTLLELARFCRNQCLKLLPLVVQS